MPDRMFLEVVTIITTGLFSLSLLCRTAVPHIRRLAILCGHLEVKGSCLPWKEKVLAFKFLVQNSALERTVQQLSKGSPELKFDRKKRIPGSIGNKSIWITCKIADETSSAWNPESRLIYVLYEDNEDVPIFDSDSDESHMSDDDD